MLNIESPDNPGALITRYVKSTRTLKSFTHMGYEYASMDGFTSGSAVTFTHHLDLARVYYQHTSARESELVYNKIPGGYAFMPLNSPTVKVAED